MKIASPLQWNQLKETSKAVNQDSVNPYVSSAMFRNKNLNFYNRSVADSYQTSNDPHRDPVPQIPYAGLLGSIVKPDNSVGIRESLAFTGNNRIGMLIGQNSTCMTVVGAEMALPGVPLDYLKPDLNRDLFWVNFNTSSISGSRKLDKDGKSIVPSVTQSFKNVWR